jgi:hypothetical protein
MIWRPEASFVQVPYIVLCDPSVGFVCWPTFRPFVGLITWPLLVLFDDSCSFKVHSWPYFWPKLTLIFGS